MPKVAAALRAGAQGGAAGAEGGADAGEEGAAAAAKLEALASACGGGEAATQLLQTALLPQPAATLREGGVIAAGYSPQLDKLRELQNGARDQSWKA